MVAKLGHGADRGPRAPDRIALLDGDGGRDAFDPIDPRLVHALEELPGVGGKRLDVATLPFGEKGVEGQRTFPRSAQPRDDDEPPEGQIEVEVLQIIVPDAAQTNGGCAHWFWHCREM